MSESSRPAVEWLVPSTVRVQSELPLTRAEIRRSAIAQNCAALKRHAGAGVALMAMVKSNGYGHGTRSAAQAAIDGGATWLGIASPAEAADVADCNVPVLLVTWAHPRHIGTLLEAGVHLTVFDRESVEAIAQSAAAMGRVADVHVKIDTGMHRLGAEPDQAGDVLRALAENSGTVRLAGIYTHFADSDAEDFGYTIRQHELFMKLLPQFKDLAPDAVVHCSNSAAMLRDSELNHDMVRCGIAVYGYVPPFCPASPELRPAMTLRATITRIHEPKAGATVGYGRTWTSPGGRRIATLSLGYGYGVPRDLSNNGHVLLGSTRCPIVGRVSMDLMTIDVTDAVGAARGDEVVIFGESDGALLGADEMASWLGTIPHELLTGVSARVQRVERDR